MITSKEIRPGKGEKQQAAYIDRAACGLGFVCYTNPKNTSAHIVHDGSFRLHCSSSAENLFRHHYTPPTGTLFESAVS